MILFSTSLFCSPVNLTQEEKNWIKSHPKIVLGIEKSWAPMIIVNSDGTLSGIDADIVNHLNKTLGTNITFKVGKWDLLDKMLQKKQIDGLSSSSANPKRAKYANFTDSYMEAVKSVFVKKANPLNIHKAEDLAGRSIAIQQGNIFDEKLVSKYPNVKIVYGKDYRSLSDFLILSQNLEVLNKTIQGLCLISC